MIKEIAFTCYGVSSLAKARPFYEEVLGLTPASIYEDLWLEYLIEGAAFCLTTYTQPSPIGGSVAFEVDDLDATLAKVQTAGAPVQGEVIDTPVCRMFMVQDPDGNVVIIHQRKAAHP